jgi:hypothetical protein
MNDLFGEPRTKASSGSKSTSTQHSPPVIRPDGQYACVICGAPAYFGFGVKLRAGLHGRWACSEHREALKQSHRK